MELINKMETEFALLVLTLTAAIWDLRYRRIPNALILSGLIIGLCITVINQGTHGLLISLAGFSLGFIMLLPGYLLRFTGAGDLKLFAVMGVFTGPVMLLQIFMASVLAGALFVLLHAVWKIIHNDMSLFVQRYKSMLQSFLTTGQFNYIPSNQESVLKQRLPMAPFYASGCLIILMFPLI
jgi:prepilin peptidase CpaA